MKIALTGATGSFGSHVLTELYEHGHDVTALVRNDPARLRPSRLVDPAIGGGGLAM